MANLILDITIGDPKISIKTIRKALPYLTNTILAVLVAPAWPLKCTRFLRWAILQRIQTPSLAITTPMNGNSTGTRTDALPHCSKVVMHILTPECQMTVSTKESWPRWRTAHERSMRMATPCSLAVVRVTLEVYRVKTSKRTQRRDFLKSGALSASSRRSAQLGLSQRGMSSFSHKQIQKLFPSIRSLATESTVKRRCRFVMSTQEVTTYTISLICSTTEFFGTKMPLIARFLFRASLLTSLSSLTFHLA